MVANVTRRSQAVSPTSAASPPDGSGRLAAEYLAEQSADDAPNGRIAGPGRQRRRESTAAEQIPGQSADQAADATGHGAPTRGIGHRRALVPEGVEQPRDTADPDARTLAHT